MCGYSAEHIRRLCVSGKITGHKVGKTWVTTKEEIERFMIADQVSAPTLAEIAGTSVFFVRQSPESLSYCDGHHCLLPGRSQPDQAVQTGLIMPKIKLNLVTATEDLVNQKVQDC